MRILLLSAYDAESHIYWRKGLVEHLPEHDWTVLTLPGRYFSWRLRGNSLSWAFGEREILEQGYDLVIATSMTDLSALRGFLPQLACTPALVYFHENQFAYPSSGREFKSVEPLVLNLYTALAADYCLFNSQYNRQTFLDGAGQLLAKLPDKVPSGLLERIEQRSSCLPVPLGEDRYLAPDYKSKEQGSLQITWNHRWEFDKNPQLLLEAMIRLQALTDRFTLNVVGQQFRHLPEAFTQLKQQLGDRIGNWGYLESRADYQRLLQQSDVVLSTALHDYQGLAVLEGVAAGAVPVVPDRLAYKELFPAHCRYSEEDEAESLAQHLLALIREKEARGCLETVAVDQLSWSVLQAQYRQIIADVAAGKLPQIVSDFS